MYSHYKLELLSLTNLYISAMLSIAVLVQWIENDGNNIAKKQKQKNEESECDFFCT